MAEYKKFWVDLFDGGKRAVTPDSLDAFGKDIVENQVPGAAQSGNGGWIEAIED